LKTHRAADEEAAPAGEEHFSGSVRMSTIFTADGPGEMNSHRVTFEPGARTHWHSHPDGQALIVTDGRGRTQVEDGAVVTFAPGDAIYLPSGVRHWHGADPDSSMTHISVTGEGGTAWDGPPVTEDQYRDIGQE
jgi:quercetin dioxygenase-like cupin family protein